MDLDEFTFNPEALASLAPGAANRQTIAATITADGDALAGDYTLNLRANSEAADVISRNPATLQLRYLQTLTEIGVEQNSTVVLFGKVMFKPDNNLFRRLSGRKEKKKNFGEEKKGLLKKLFRRDE